MLFESTIADTENRDAVQKYNIIQNLGIETKITFLG